MQASDDLAEDVNELNNSDKLVAFKKYVEQKASFNHTKCTDMSVERLQYGLYPLFGSYSSC